MSEQKNLDAFEQMLEQEKQKLEQCQKERNIDSCLKCEKTLDCEVRKSYVSAVYKSMSKGKSGDFEF